MKKEEKDNPLKMHQDAPAKTESDQEKAEEVSSEKTSAEKKSTFELPASSLLAAELQEMYDEDKVVHRQGHSEPESD
jgi:hypothetical protein